MVGPPAPRHQPPPRRGITASRRKKPHQRAPKRNVGGPAKAKTGKRGQAKKKAPKAHRKNTVPAPKPVEAPVQPNDTMVPRSYKAGGRAAPPQRFGDREPDPVAESYGALKVAPKPARHRIRDKKLARQESNILKSVEDETPAGMNTSQPAIIVDEPGPPAQRSYLSILQPGLAPESVYSQVEGGKY